MLAILFIIFGVLIRLIPHIPNVTPIAAVALFGGVYFSKRFSIVVPLVAMFFSDIFLGFYSPVVMISVYGSFIMAGLIGWWLRKRKNMQNIVFASVGSSVLFFVITNFAVWLGGWYPRNLTGFIECYTLAMPFFRNTIIGDLFYTGVFFGVYELVLRLVKKSVVETVTQ